MAPSMDFFMCESCEEKFESRMALGIHQKDCEEWERELAFYEMTKTVKEKDTHSITRLILPWGKRKIALGSGITNSST